MRLAVLRFPRPPRKETLVFSVRAPEGSRRTLAPTRRDRFPRCLVLSAVGGRGGGQEASWGRSTELDEPQSQRGRRSPRWEATGQPCGLTLAGETCSLLFFRLVRLERCPRGDMKTHLRL